MASSQNGREGICGLIKKQYRFSVDVWLFHFVFLRAHFIRGSGLLGLNICIVQVYVKVAALCINKL